MTQEQQIIAEDFQNMIESEYALCVQEIRRANQAIVDTTTAEADEQHKLECVNLEIDAIGKYWQLRLGHLIEFIDTKNRKLNQELAQKYLTGKEIGVNF